MPVVTFTGPDEYGGVDPETGQDVRLSPGEAANVSDAKAEQLLRDFPDWFTAGGEVAVVVESGPVPAGPDLDSMTKAELLERAQALGLSPANAAMTKEELRAAIDAA